MVVTTAPLKAAPSLAETPYEAKSGVRTAPLGHADGHGEFHSTGHAPPPSPPCHHGEAGPAVAPAAARSSAAAASERTKTYAVTTARSTFVEEEFALWKRYQAAIHGDDPSELTRSSYERFLVHSPFDDELAGPTTPSTGYGAFHQQYRIDGVLVAVGVPS